MSINEPHDWTAPRRSERQPGETLFDWVVRDNGLTLRPQIEALRAHLVSRRNRRDPATGEVLVGENAEPQARMKVADAECDAALVAVGAILEMFNFIKQMTAVDETLRMAALARELTGSPEAYIRAIYSTRLKYPHLWYGFLPPPPEGKKERPELNPADPFDGDRPDADPNGTFGLPAPISTSALQVKRKGGVT